MPVLCAGFILSQTLLLVVQTTEGILDFILSKIPSRKRGIVPPGYPTESWGSFSPEALANISSNLIGLNWGICPPLSQPLWPGDGRSDWLKPVRVHTWELDISTCWRKGRNWGSLKAKCGCCDRRRGKWTLRRQPRYFYYINTSIILIKAKLEAMQI